MAEYIERQAVLNLPQSITRNFVGEVVERSIDVEDIKDLPAADVVRVVRCRDCKYLGTFRGKLYCRHNCGIVEPKEDDFCSRGERKE